MALLVLNQYLIPELVGIIGDYIMPEAKLTKSSTSKLLTHDVFGISMDAGGWIQEIIANLDILQYNRKFSHSNLTKIDDIHKWLIFVSKENYYEDYGTELRDFSEDITNGFDYKDPMDSKEYYEWYHEKLTDLERLSKYMPKYLREEFISHITNEVLPRVTGGVKFIEEEISV